MFLSLSLSLPLPLFPSLKSVKISSGDNYKRKKQVKSISIIHFIYPQITISTRNQSKKLLRYFTDSFWSESAKPSLYFTPKMHGTCHVGPAMPQHSCLEAVVAQALKGRGSMPGGEVGHLAATGAQVGPGGEGGEDLEEGLDFVLGTLQGSLEEELQAGGAEVGCGQATGKGQVRCRRGGRTGQRSGLSGALGGRVGWEVEGGFWSTREVPGNRKGRQATPKEQPLSSAQLPPVCHVLGHPLPPSKKSWQPGSMQTLPLFHSGTRLAF